MSDIKENEGVKNVIRSKERVLFLVFFTGIAVEVFGIIKSYRGFELSKS